MRVVRLVFGVSLFFSTIALIVLLMNLKTCNVVLRVGFALFSAFVVFWFSAIRFGLHVSEIKLVSWVDVKVKQKVVFLPFFFLSDGKRRPPRCLRSSWS